MFPYLLLNSKVITALISNAPNIVKSSRDLVDYVSKKRSAHDKEPNPENHNDQDIVREQFQNLTQRVDKLENDESKQAELISKMADHEHEISIGLRILSVRVSLLIWIAIAALIAALAALIMGLISLSTQ
ncbi:hypothetical protein M1N56_06260 [Dehalococcoidia bacterium]|nr:hypothetical protein [Dehalococcoidia bacterium]